MKQSATSARKRLIWRGFFESRFAESESPAHTPLTWEGESSEFRLEHAVQENGLIPFEPEVESPLAEADLAGVSEQGANSSGLEGTGLPMEINFESSARAQTTD